MLLPTFQFPPNKDIVLGTLRRRAKGLKTRPDPYRPLNRYTGATLHIPDSPNFGEITNFHFEGMHGRGGKAGVFADVPVLSAISGSLGFGQDRIMKLIIDCTRVEVHTFEPSAEYPLQALRASKLVTDYILESWRPSIFLVTGLMVAYGANVKILRGSDEIGQSSISADLSTVGAPVRVSVGGCGHSNMEVQREMNMSEPFILSYRLQKLRMSRKGSLKSSAQFDSFALMSSGNDDENISADKVLEKAWETETLTPTSLSMAADEESDDNEFNEAYSVADGY